MRLDRVTAITAVVQNTHQSSGCMLLESETSAHDPNWSEVSLTLQP